MRKSCLVLLLLTTVFIIVNAQQVVTSGGYSEKNNLSVKCVLVGKFFGYNFFEVNDPPVVKSIKILY